MSGLCKSAVSAAAKVSRVGGGGIGCATALGAPLCGVLVVPLVVRSDRLLEGARDRFKVAAVMTSFRFGAAVMRAAADPPTDFAMPVVAFVLLPTVGFGLT